MAMVVMIENVLKVDTLINSCLNGKKYVLKIKYCGKKCANVSLQIHKNLN